MRNNVSYAEITCDICGKIENIAASLVLPEGWEKVSVGYESWDACEECKRKIIETIRNIKGGRG